MNLNFSATKIDLSINIEHSLIDETFTLSLYRQDRAIGAYLVDNQKNDALICGLEFDLPNIASGVRAFWGAI